MRTRKLKMQLEELKAKVEQQQQRNQTLKKDNAKIRKQLFKWSLSTHKKTVDSSTKVEPNRKLTL